jgi:hypothetical protein
MGVNRGYKDSVFSWLFGEPETLRELYGAIEGVSLPPDIPVTINTLEGVLFKTRMNDISFEIGDKLVVLIEHQSTILKLSDSFNDIAALGLAAPDFLSLELVVRVYNINQGHNAPIIQACKTLKGYSAFIAKVREYEERVAVRADAMKMAINYCIKNNILKDFLKIHASEVINMLLTEWNWDDALAVQKEEGWEEGLEEGQNMVLELLDQGYTPEQIRAKLKTSSTKTAGKT